MRYPLRNGMRKQERSGYITGAPFGVATGGYRMPGRWRIARRRLLFSIIVTMLTLALGGCLDGGSGSGRDTPLPELPGGWSGTIVPSSTTMTSPYHQGVASITSGSQTMIGDDGSETRVRVIAGQGFGIP
jgi:hypothetical protein